jgi:drug/metabolite transporter (DMT)-like permease
MSLAAGVVLLAALAHAVWNTMVKGSPGGTADPEARSVALALSWVVLAGPVCALAPLPDVASWPNLGASIAIHVVYFASVVGSYRAGDLGVVYPLARGLPPLFVALAAAILGDPLALGGWLGVALLSIGVLTLSIGPETSRPSRRALSLAILSASLTTAYTVIDGFGARASGSVAAYVAWLCAGQGAAYAALCLVRGGRRLAARVRREAHRGLVAGALAAAGYGAVVWAMTIAPIAGVAALRETSVLFAALLATFFLGEPFGGRRIASALAIAAGAFAIEWSAG